MREIKFRMWDTKEMVMSSSPGYLINLHGDIYTVDNINGVTYYKRDNYILMQYTGLKDKNGTEIYEGDVVEASYYETSRPFWRDLVHKKEIDEKWEDLKKIIKKKKAEIEYYNGCFRWNYIKFGNFSINQDQLDSYIKRGEGISSEYEERYWDFEVIGNIYENPELL